MRWNNCRNLWAVGIVLLNSLGSVSQPLTRPSMLRATVDSIVSEAIRQQAFPGARVLAWEGDSLLVDAAYGYHTYDSLRPVKHSDIYDLASITKITSVLPCIMRLVGEGKFDIDATLGEYVPEFSKSNKSDLTWREILAHNARLKSWIPYWKNTLRKNGKFKARTFKKEASKRFPVEITDSLYLHRKYYKKIFREIRRSPLNAEEGYIYSGLAFYILPRVIENISGRSFQEYLAEEIFDPAGIDTMCYTPLLSFPRDIIVPTERDTFFRKSQLHGRVHDEGAAMMGGVSGNAGLFGTAYDLGKVGRLYLGYGVLNGDTILLPEVVREFTRCQYCFSGNRRGLGFDKPPWRVDPEAVSVTISPKASPSSFGHSGYTGTLLWVDPVKDLIFVFLSNRVYPTRENWRINELKVRPAVHEALYNAIE